MWILFLKYWKQILIPLTVIFLLVGIYYKGRLDGARVIERKLEAEYRKKVDEYLKQIEKSSKKVEEIRKYRKNNRNDEVDSCLLSSNPIKSDCI